ncbi:uncharacterized protein LOC144477179 [Augochlora pura]
MKQAEKTQRNLHTCYIDYKKAFDSVPHSWLLKVLQIYKIDQQLQQFLKETMKNWRTRIHITTKTYKIATDLIKIKTGIFQGDSLSALWFCMSLNPLSNALNNTNYGYAIKTDNTTHHKINHLLYMDDIKLYGSNTTHITGILKIVENITTDIGMEFGMNKCKQLHIEKGRWITEDEPITLNNQILDNLEQNETYKYLGFQQNTRINHTQIKSHLKKQYTQRLQTLLKTKLNSKNLFKAINTYAIPILTYSFGIIKWSNTDLENMNITTRTQLTKYRNLHPNANKDRITIARDRGGRGLIDIHILHAKQIKSLRKYFHSKQTPLHKAIVIADKHHTPLNLAKQTQDNDEYDETQIYQQKIDTWKSKEIHSKHWYNVNKEEINKENTYKWLKNGQLFPETEGFMMAIQDQVIATKNYRKYIIKDNAIENDTCRKCHQTKETIDHIISGCKLMAGQEHVDRHNIAAKIIHQTIKQAYEISTNNIPYYNYTPETIIENENYMIYWDRTIHTDKTVIHNRPDITVQDKKEKTTYLIDISIPRNLE